MLYEGQTESLLFPVKLTRAPAQLAAIGLYELECRGLLQLVINVLHQANEAALLQLLPTLMGVRLAGPVEDSAAELDSYNVQKLSPFRGLHARLALIISHLKASRLTLEQLNELFSREESSLGSSSFDGLTATPILFPFPYYSPLSIE